MKHVDLLGCPGWRLAMFSFCTVAAAFGQDREVEVILSEPVPYPESPELYDTPKGKATVMVQVDQDGQLVDALVTEYSRPAFGRAALEAVESLTFQPGMRDGKPLGGRMPVEFNFESRGGVTLQNTIDHIEEQLIGVRMQDLVANARELDEPMKVLSAVRPVSPAGITEPTEIVVDFFVDQEGLPRMVMVSKGTHANAAAVSVEAVRQWRFAPPFKSGRPAIVRVHQRFAFNPVEEESPATED